MRYLLLCVLAVAVLLAAAADSRALLNPHIKPEPCESCHVKVPTKADGRAGNYFLLKETIDDTCHVCHEKTCCKAGTLHHFEHPSNIDQWDKTRFKAPKTLKLYGGFITCSTCHDHSIPAGESFKMVRLAQRDGMRIEWVRLCRDCHTSF
jgi:hypothetical protein